MSSTVVRKRKAFITGYTGQDGQFLTDLLLRQDYQVIALVRRVSTEPPLRSRGMFDFSKYITKGKLLFEQGDLLSPHSLNQIIKRHQPDEIYNLAAQSHVGLSFSQPEFTIASILNGTINLITALEDCHYGDWRMYQASTSEMFGDKTTGTMLDENSSFNPTSPYAIAKLAAHQYCEMKRKAGLYISCGILFNHESQIRGGDFVTQKIARGVVEWNKSKTPILIGNLDASRDWGYAGDYVKAMQLMLAPNNPDDYVVATGETRTVRDFIESAFAALNKKIYWDSSSLGFIDGILAVKVDPQFFRPSEVGYLLGNSEKIREHGWKPDVTFHQMVQKMVHHADQMEKVNG